MLELESSAFAIIPGEDEATNPEVYGKNRAQWLAEELRADGIPATGIIAEDFGWCVGVESNAHVLYVACASSQEEANSWRVFAFAEGGLMSRLLGKPERAATLASLFTAVRRYLESNQNIHGLREYAT